MHHSKIKLIRPKATFADFHSIYYWTAPNGDEYAITRRDERSNWQISPTGDRFPTPGDIKIGAHLQCYRRTLDDVRRTLADLT